MTLDEAIKHAEEVAEEKEINAENQDTLFPNDIEECKKCAEEHRQLAEWLKDYKRLLEQEPCEGKMKYVQETVNTIMNTCRTDSIKDKCFRNAARFIQNAIDGSSQEFELIKERPHGKWEKAIDHYHDKIVFRCSICRRVVRDCYRDDLAELYPYCHCGADMRKEADNE